MFRKIAAVTAALLIAIGVMSASTLQSADASGTDTGPCVTAVWKDDPTITAQRGDCPEVEASPTPTPTETQAATVTYFTSLRIGVNEPARANEKFDIQVIDAVGEAVVSQTVTLDGSGYGFVDFTDSVEVPARWEVEGAPQYVVWLEFAGGYLAERAFTGSDFTRHAGNPISYTLTGESFNTGLGGPTGRGIWAEDLS